MARIFIKYGLLIGLTSIIVCSFLYHLPFMAWYIQYGPILIVTAVIFIAAIFEKPSENVDHDNEEEKERDDGYLKRNVLILSYILVLSITLKQIFGKPENSSFDYQTPDFWFFFFCIFVITVLNAWNYNKA